MAGFILTILFLVFHISIDKRQQRPLKVTHNYHKPSLEVNCWKNKIGALYQDVLSLI